MGGCSSGILSTDDPWSDDESVLLGKSSVASVESGVTSGDERGEVELRDASLGMVDASVMFTDDSSVVSTGMIVILS